MIKNPYFRAMRVERWPRSIAIFVGTYFYLLLNRVPINSLDFFKAIIDSSIAFILTISISFLNYIINEFADAPFDIHHPLKKERPLVRGEVKKGKLILIAILLFAFAISISLTYFSPNVTLSLLLLFIAGIFYNIKPIRLKDVPFLDSISESVNNPIRLLIGWFSAGGKEFPPLLLLILFWLAGNFLLSAKRLSELKNLGIERAKAYRKSFSGYTHKSLFIFIVLSALSSFFLFIWFSWREKIITFIFSTPFFLALIVWIFLRMSKDKVLADEPEVLIKKPFFSLILILIFLFIISALVFH